jgi:adenylate kinase
VRHRYRVFKEHTWDALQSLKELFPYHFIPAMGRIEEVQENILKELQYQSSLELDPRTFDRLRDIPLAEEIVRHARPELIRRLDGYELESPELFDRVVSLVRGHIMPVVQRHALSGLASYNTEDALLHDPRAVEMLIDVFSERGYHAIVDIHHIEIPQRVDLATGEITCREKKVFRIQIRYRSSEIRH